MIIATAIKVALILTLISLPIGVMIDRKIKANGKEKEVSKKAFKMWVILKLLNK